MADRQKITPKQLQQHVKRNGPNVGLLDIQAKGIITITSKDGKVRKLPITSKPKKELNDAT